MSRARLTLIALGMALALPTLAAATESLKAAADQKLTDLALSQDNAKAA